MIIRIPKDFRLSEKAMEKKYQLLESPCLFPLLLCIHRFS